MSTLDECFFGFSREMLDDNLSFACLTFTRKRLTIQQSHWESTTSILGSFSIIVCYDSLFEIIGISSIERIVGTMENVCKIAHMSLSI